MPRILRRCIQVLMASVLALNAVAASAPTSSGRDVIEAIWRVQDFDFTYRSARNFYDCDDLRASLGELLRTLGAHESVRIQMRCTGFGGIASYRAHISVAVAVEATDENIRAATRFDARERLVARLGGFTLPTAANVERFPAAWRSVAFSVSGQHRPNESDCELLSEVQQQIFPRLSVRSAARLYCLPWASRVTQRLEVQALVRVSPTARVRGAGGGMSIRNGALGSSHETDRRLNALDGLLLASVGCVYRHSSLAREHTQEAPMGDSE